MYPVKMFIKNVSQRIFDVNVVCEKNKIKS